MFVSGGAIEANIIGPSATDLFDVPASSNLEVEYLWIAAKTFASGQTYMLFATKTVPVPIGGVIAAAAPWLYFVAFARPYVIAAGDSLQLATDGSVAGVASYGWAGNLVTP